MMRTSEMSGGRASIGLSHGASSRRNRRAAAALRERHGFTLVEMIVTLTVAAIIAAVTIPSLVTWYQSYKATERQANAELIYTTAQNNMAQLKANGQLDDTQGDTTALSGDRVTLASATKGADTFSVATDAKKADAGISVLSSDDASHKDGLDLLVPNIVDSLSRVGYSSMSYATGAHYVIEYDKTLGYVYRVFFSEDGISQGTYMQAAAAAAGHDDAELARLGVSYYGGTTPKTFVPSDHEAVRWIGYFEFSGTARDASVTGGYYYQIGADNQVNGNVVDRLHNGNHITEGAVDSGDGTAYGVLVSRSAVDNGSFTPPTDTNPTPYQVTISGEFGMPGVETSCYFYKLATPSTSSGEQAAYTIHYECRQQYWTDTRDQQLQGSVGSSVRVTNDNLDKDSGGWAKGYLDQGYRIDPNQSTLSGTVTADGTCQLKVVLTKSDDGLTSLPNPTVVNGVGTWYPWSTANKDELKNLAFYVNQNFAGCIARGTDAPTGNAVSTYQVRTDDQLQHIGSPYGSTYDAPNVSYLDKAFFQTHDITINQLWYPIGQEQSNASVGGKSVDTDARFSGHFYGGYAGTGQDKLAQDASLNLQEPKEGDQTFTITLAQRADTTDEGSKGKLFSVNPAYTTSDGYRSYGIFGYVTGSIEYAQVFVGTEDAGLDLAQSFDTPHYGTLVGDLVADGSANTGSATDGSPRKGSVAHSSVTVAKSSSLRMGQGSGSEDWRTTDDAIVGGLCGYMGGAATISDSSLTLEDNGADEREPRFELAASPRENIGKSVSVGGLVGRASCDSAKFLSNCSVGLNDDAKISAQGNTSGNKQVSAGGLIGYAKAGDQASIEDCDMTLKGTLTVGTPDSNGAWSNPSYIGGFAGYAEGGIGIKNATIETAKNTSGSIVATAKANGVRAAAGGMFGYLHNTGFDTATAGINGDLAVTAVSTNSEGHAGGLVGRADCDKSRLTLEKASLTVGGNAFIANSTTINNATGSSYDAHAGGLAGSLSNMTLSNATATVNGDGKSLKVSADNAHTSATAGGLVGELERAGNITAPKLTARTLTVTSSDDDSSAISGGLIGKATDDADAQSTISKAAITVNGDADIESTGTVAYALSGLLAGQLDSVAVDGATSNVTGNLASKATDKRSASARAAGLVAQFENGAALNAATLTVSGNLEATASSTNGSSLTGGLVAYAASDPAPLQTTGATLNVTGNLDAHSSASNTSQDSFSGALAGQLRSVGFASPTVTVGGSLTSTTESVGGPARAGGLIGEIVRNGNVDAAGLSSVSPTLHDTTVTAKSTNNDAHAGGLAGRDDSSNISDSDLSPQGRLTVRASDSGNELHAGGYVGSVDSATVSGASLSPTGDVSVDATNTARTVHAGGFAGKATSSTISNASMRPTGRAAITANGANEVRSGGFVAQADSTVVSDTSFAPGSDLDVTGTTSGYSATYVGGLMGQANNSASVTKTSMSPAGTTAVTATSNADVFASGAIGQADSSTLSDSSLTPGGNLNVEGTSSESGSAYVGGLVGQAKSLAASNDALQPNASVVVNATGKSNAYSGGLMGYVEGSGLSYLSLLEGANAGNASVSVSGDTSAGSGPAYVAGGFGNASDTSIDNSYVVTRNAPLVLSNKGNSGATGGFAGQATASGGNHSITASYVNASINSSSPSLAGFIDSTSASGNNLLVTSDFVIASMSGDTPGNQTAAFVRSVSYVNGIRGNYAVVTDAAGTTPYKFAINGDLNAENGTERCFIYRADMTELVDEKFDQKDGAHPASYAYLTQANNAEVTVPWNKSLKTRSVLDFLGTVSQPGITARYGFVTKDSVATMRNDGDNPFPTATKDKDGNYINYGTWPAPPATSVDATDESEADSSGSKTTDPGNAQNGAGANAGNANAAAATPANGTANGSADASANAAVSAVAPAGDSSSAASSPSDDAGSNGGDAQ